MLDKIRSKLIKIDDYNDSIIVRSLFGKKVFLKDDIRVVNRDIFLKEYFIDSKKNNLCCLNENISPSDMGGGINRYKTLISMGGFFGSGTTAAVDILREFDNTTIIGGIEIETCNKSSIKQPSLEVDFYRRTRLFEFGNILDIKDEIEIDRQVKMLIRDMKKYLEKELSMQKIFSINPIEEFNKVILSFLEYDGAKIHTIKSSLPYKSVESHEPNLIKTNYCDYIFYRIKNGITKDFINSQIALFVNKVLNSINSKDFLVLDGFIGVSTGNMQGWDIESHKKFLQIENLKSIVIYRDPRDQFMTNFLFSEHLDYDTVERCVNEKAMDDYLHYINKYAEPHKDRLFMSFESLVNDYEKSINKIYDFLNIDQFHHVNKFRYFQPEISRKNIGIYKHFHNQDIMKKVKEKFKDYCYG